MLRNFQLLESGIDVAPLLGAIERQPELFSEITARQEHPGSPHKYTEAIFLRWAKELTVEACFTDLEAVDYPAYEKLPEARPLVAQIMRRVGGKKLARVMIANLKSGGFIDPHSDEGAYADHFERFHLSLQSDDGNSFLVWNRKPDWAEWVHMKPGELWAFNHKSCHQVLNDSNRDRLHLIVDCVAPEYRRERE
jgi:hypothetical protein